MTACPSQDQLRQLLDDRLMEMVAEIVGHVEVCPTCQQHLEDLTHNKDWKTTLNGLLSAATMVVIAEMAVPAGAKPLVYVLAGLRALVGLAWQRD